MRGRWYKIGEKGKKREVSGRDLGAKLVTKFKCNIYK